MGSTRGSILGRLATIFGAQSLEGPRRSFGSRQPRYATGILVFNLKSFDPSARRPGNSATVSGTAPTTGQSFSTVAGAVFFAAQQLGKLGSCPYTTPAGSGRFYDESDRASTRPAQPRRAPKHSLAAWAARDEAKKSCLCPTFLSLSAPWQNT